MVSDRVIAIITGTVCVTALGITFFVVVRQDGTVLASLTGAIGALVGYLFGKKTGEEK